MNSFRAEEELPLQGSIVQIPLIIENEATSTTLSKSWIWVHVTKADYEPSDDPNFINISLVAIWQEGYYHATITKQNIYGIFDNLSSTKIKVSRDKAYDVFTDLFPLDLETFLESGNKVGVHTSLLIGAKIRVSESRFRKGEGLNTDTLQIQIKSSGTFNPTIGKFDMQSVDFETSENLKNEGNLFNWMELLYYQRQEVTRRYIQDKAEKERLQTDNNLLQQAMEQTKIDFEDIRVDMESKFYQEMNLKKDVIYELARNDLPKTELLGLNANFLNNAMVQNNGKGVTNPKERYNRRKRSKKMKAVSSKKQKMNTRKVDSEDDFEEYKDDTDFTDVDEIDENYGHLAYTKVKKEPRLKHASKSHDGENGSWLNVKGETGVKKEPVVKIEPEVGSGVDPSDNGSDFGFRPERERITLTAPRSPELKDDSNSVRVKPDPYPNSTPFNPDAFSLRNEDSQDTLKVESLLRRSRNPSLNLETDREVFNNVTRVESQQGDEGGEEDVEEEKESNEEKDGEKGNQDGEYQTEYSFDESDDSDGTSGQDDELKDKGRNEDKDEKVTRTGEKGNNLENENFEDSFIEDSLDKSVFESKPDANNSFQDRTDYSEKEPKAKSERNLPPTNQRARSQAEVETDYSNADDDDYDDDDD
ncbi:unnamed protein product [Candida parapsilosis]|uniref:Uncharacterized protein n=1 Tax=Candida parapsilosis (strain CDC 317 / ATCC MYA-4646) TaxID=578454 RepID=G8B577_CANPC|nr:uncharacterized protein CPAR2_601890 [Candida parapsilosis]CCE39769.1 hypothetical protein CPAR2_601890 [Candida parapsilosis]